MVVAGSTRPHTHPAVLWCAVLLQSELASLQTTLAREQGAAQNATGRLAVLEASLAEQQVGVSLPPLRPPGVRPVCLPCHSISCCGVLLTALDRRHPRPGFTHRGQGVCCMPACWDLPACQELPAYQGSQARLSGTACMSRVEHASCCRVGGHSCGLGSLLHPCLLAGCLAGCVQGKVLAGC